MNLPFETYGFTTVAHITNTVQATLRRRIELGIVRASASGRGGKGSDLRFLFADLLLAHVMQALSDQGVSVETQKAVATAYYSAEFNPQKSMLVVIDGQAQFTTKAEAKKLIDRGVQALVADVMVNGAKLRMALDNCQEAIAAAPSN